MYKVIIILMTVFIFSSCSSEKVTEKSKTGDTSNRMEVSEFKYNTDGNDYILKNDVEVVQDFVKITYVNDYNDTLYYDDSFVLQKLDGAEYKNIDLLNSVEFNNAYKMLEKDKSYEEEIDIISGLFGELEKGHYRVIKEVYKKESFSSEEEKIENTIFVSTEFDIK